MEIMLVTLAGAGLLGCFGATVGLDIARGRRLSRRLSRPRSFALRYD